MFGRKSNGDAQAQVEAIGRSQAVIEFNLDGTIITANQNFLDALGYPLAEIKGKHHSMFVDRPSSAKRRISGVLGRLNRGEYQAAEYKRIAKGGTRNLDPGLLQPDPGQQRQAVSRSSSSPPTSPRKRSAAWRMPARSPPSTARRR